MGLIPGQGTKIPYAAGLSHNKDPGQSKKKKLNKENDCECKKAQTWSNGE